jgi:hypothetical protein
MSDFLDRLFDDTQRHPFDIAARTAAASAGLTGVFTAAYHGALCANFGVDPDRRTALCVTEDGGNTPRAIQTRFAANRLHGTKSFVTFGDAVDDLLVLAVRSESEDGRRDLVIAKCGKDEVHIVESLHTPFMPDISHARVLLEGSAATVLFEDAWPLIKNFRLVEDLYVVGGTLSWLIALSRSAGAAATGAELAALYAAARQLADRDPTAPQTHLAFDGLHRLARERFDAFDWSKVDTDTRTDWERDRSVLDIASTARAARAELARRAFVEDP